MNLLRNILKQEWLIIVILITIAFILSCSITTIFSTMQSKHQVSVSAAILGDSRVALSQHFFETADLYFHKGAEHIHKKKFSNDIFQRISHIVSPTKHVHIAHSNIKEIMPWLWLSIKTNPHNLETYLTASFWLANSAGKPDVAMQVLEEAQKNNPYNYQVQIEKGRLFLKAKDLKNAKLAFDAALIFWNKTADPENEEARMDKAEILLYRGLLAEHDGDIPYAVKLYKEIIKMFPERTGIADRISTLEKGEIPDKNPNSLWNLLTRENTKERSECHHHDDD